MDGAFEIFRVRVEAIQWMFTQAYIEKWRRENPDGRIDDLIEDCRKKTDEATDVLADAEVEKGATRTEAERLVRNMR